MANTEGRDVLGRLRKDAAHWTKELHGRDDADQFGVFVRVADIDALLAVVEAAKDAQVLFDLVDGGAKTLDEDLIVSIARLRSALARLYDGSSGETE